MEVVVNASPCDKKDEKKEYGKWDKWEIESCADCLMRAEEIRADKEKMAYIKPFIEKKYEGAKRAVSSMKDIEARKAALAEEDDD